MLNPVSPVLRKAGENLTQLAKEIEDSQVEDGDPPFLVFNSRIIMLVEIIHDLEAVKDSLTEEL